MTWLNRSRRQLPTKRSATPILPRALEGCPDRFRPEYLRRLDNLDVEDCVPVVDQVSRHGVIGEGLPQLLPNPRGSWMPSDIEVQDLPSIVRDHKEAVQNAEGQAWYGEEIHRRDDLAMVGQEGLPSLPRFRLARSLLHPAQDRSLRDLEAEHLQFAVDARRTPARILGDHLEDQRAQLLARWPSPSWPALPRAPSPVPAKPGLMPADDGLRLNQNQRHFPTRPELLEQDPEHPVRSSHARSGSFGRKNDELLPQGQILKKEITPGTERMGDQCLQESQQACHGFIFTLKPIPEMLQLPDSAVVRNFGEVQALFGLNQTFVPPHPVAKIHAIVADMIKRYPAATNDAGAILRLVRGSEISDEPVPWILENHINRQNSLWNSWSARRSQDNRCGSNGC